MNLISGLQITQEGWLKIVIEGAPSKYETTASKHILDEEFEGKKM